ncbi:MAG: efflux RND transporter periplasmic adaptor subunit [Pseudomonadota bacterium]
MNARLVPLLVIPAVLAACGAPPAAEEPTIRSARIETVEPAGSQARREFVGRVEARLTVDLAFQVGGRLADFPVSEGELISQGQTLARLEQQDFERAQREARVQLQQASTNLERQRTLHERGIASDAALEDAQTAFDLRAVALDNVRQNLEYTTVESPFDGLVSRRLVDNFSTISPGQPIARLQDVSELRVAIQVPESLIALVDETEPVEVHARFPFLPDQSFALEYRELVAEPDQASRTYTALFALPDDVPANILPGMTATVSVLIEASEQPANPGVRAPVAALSDTPEGGFMVWVYDAASGIVNARQVETGPVSGETVIIRSGLNACEQIVTAGVNALYDGMSVRPLEPARELCTTAPPAN